MIPPGHGVQKTQATRRQELFTEKINILLVMMIIIAYTQAISTQII